MNLHSLLRLFRRTLTTGTLFVGMAIAASSAHAFTSAELSAFQSSIGAGSTNVVASSESVLGVVEISTTNSLVGMELAYAQAQQVQASGFWATMASKFKFSNVGSRAAGGCFAGTIWGGLASTKQKTVAMKALRVFTGCAAGLAAGPIAEFASAVVLAAGAPAWAGVGTAVLITGIVVGGINYAADNLYFDKEAARRRLQISNGKYIAPAGTEPAYSIEYASWGDQITNERKAPGYGQQDTTIRDDAGTYIGTDTLGGTQGTKRNCAYTAQGYACLQ